MHEERAGKATTKKQQCLNTCASYVAPNCTHVFVCLSREVHELTYSDHVTFGAWSVTMQLYYEQIGICGWNCL